MILNALFNGNIFPAEQIEMGGVPEYNEKMNRTGKIMEILEKKLSKEDFALVEECCAHNQDMALLMSEEYFKYGLAIGMKLAQEADEIQDKYNLSPDK